MKGTAARLCLLLLLLHSCWAMPGVEGQAAPDPSAPAETASSAVDVSPIVTAASPTAPSPPAATPPPSPSPPSPSPSPAASSRTATSPSVAGPPAPSPAAVMPSPTAVQSPSPVAASNPLVPSSPSLTVIVTPSTSPTTVEASPATAPSLPATLPLDTTLIINLELRGKWLVPWTQPKSYVVGKVLHDYHFPTSSLSDISVAVLASFTYMEYTDSSTSRRLAAARRLLQVEKSGVDLKITAATSSIRAQAEIASIQNSVSNGWLMNNITTAGVPVENATLLAPIQLMDASTLVDNYKFDSKLEPWAIALIVLGVLLAPVPVFLLVRSSQRKKKKAIALQRAQEEAARVRAQSRLTNPKSFTLSRDHSHHSFSRANSHHSVSRAASHHVMVRTGVLAAEVLAHRHTAGTPRSTAALPVSFPLPASTPRSTQHSTPFMQAASGSRERVVGSQADVAVASRQQSQGDSDAKLDVCRSYTS